MPNRILKDSICTSPTIDVLSRDAEVFFYRLIVQCDDYGRMDARLPILRAKCYPLQIDKVTERSIDKWLKELVDAALVTLYVVDGQTYLQMATWDRHQQVRAKRSKYPDMIASDINCNQVTAYVPVIQSNPIQSESESESESESNVAPVSATPQRKPHTSLQQEMFGAIAETCELDARLHNKRIGQTASSLLATGYTPEQVRQFKTWWLSDLWRYEHTPVPSLKMLLDKIQQFKNSADRPRPVPVAHTNGNGHVNGASKVARSMEAVDAVFDMLERGNE